VTLSSTRSSGRAPGWLAAVLGVATRSRVAWALAILAGANYILQHGLRLLRLTTQPDLKFDFFQYYRAGTALAHGTNPYIEFLTTCTRHEWCRGGYIYPTLLAELFRPLAAIPIYPAAAIWQVLSGVMVAIAFWAMYRTVRGRVSRAGWLLLFALMISFLPLYEGERLWQTGDLMLMLLALAAMAFVASEDSYLTGAWLAVGAMIKITPVLILPALVRGRWALRHRAPIIGFIATSVLLAGILALLTPYTWQYFTSVLPTSTTGPRSPTTSRSPGCCCGSRTSSSAGGRR
jgi:hypothetical protein